jgi:hypothetical protein
MPTSKKKSVFKDCEVAVHANIRDKEVSAKTVEVLVYVNIRN